MEDERIVKVDRLEAIRIRESIVSQSNRHLAEFANKLGKRVLATYNKKLAIETNEIEKLKLSDAEFVYLSRATYERGAHEQHREPNQ